MLKRKAKAPVSFNEATREIDIVVSTDTPITRGQFDEVLSHDPRAVDLSRFIGAPFLNAHKQGDARDVLGVVTRARIEGGELVATVKLSRRADAEPIITDILDGIQRATSAGYTVQRWADSVDPRTGRRVRTATRWRPLEVSLTPIGADQNAHVRAEHRSPTMRKKTTGADPAHDENDALENEPANENTMATRNAAIRTLCRDNGMTQQFCDSLVDSDGDLIAARAAVNAELQRRTPRIRTQVTQDHTDPAEIVQRRAAAIYARGAGVEPEEASREFYHDSIIDNARWALQARGQQHRALSPVDVLTRAMHTTSDFPLILENVLNKSLEAPYQVNRSPVVTKLARQKTLSTFHPASILRVGEIGPLVDLSESGEFAHTTRGEEKNTLALESGGRRIDYSGKLLVQDDVGALVDAPAQFSLAATAWENSKVLALFADNPTLGDGKEWFDATRTPSNLDAGNTPISIEALSQAKLAMRKTTGLDGVTILDIAPAFLLVSAELEDRAIQFMSAYNAQFWSETNPHKLEILVDPRLPAFEWYVFASPSRAPTIDVATLAGQSAPRVTSRENWDNWGISFRCLHHFGCAAVSARGAYKFASGEDSNSEI